MADEPLSTVHRPSDGGASSSCSRRVRWERFLPRPSLRVLLVEHDDSTRHIVSALLRKCGYYVVGVGDGLKAWEFMTEKRFQFDLVLAEVAIPSFSGIALLSRIMSSEDCKNIPVIMMSSHDSVNVVLKCMLKGAVDFLVKPVRKNELRNLWQHVWRKHSLSQQVNASENNAASNHINANAGEGSETGENSGEGKYDQSSGIKHDMETEWMQELTDSHLVEGGNSNSDGDTKLGAPNQDFADKSVADAFVVGGTLPVQGAHSDEKVQKVECSYKILPAREEASIPRRCIEEVTIDPGAYCQNICVNGLSRVSAELSQEKDEQNVSSPPLWELSLRRREFIERHALNHSNSSAFSRYGDKKIQPSNPKPSSLALEIGKNECADQFLSFHQSTDNGTDHSNKATSFFLNGKLPSPQVNVGEVPMNYHLSTKFHKDTSTLPSSDSPRENALIGCSVSGGDYSHRQQVGFMSLQIPVGATHYQTFCPGYGAILQPVFYCENSLSPHTSNTIDGVRYPLASHQSGPSDNHTDNDCLAMKFPHPGECHQPHHALNPSAVEQENRALSCPQEQANRNENCGQDALNGSRSNGSAETTNGVMRIGNALENVNESSFQNCNKEAPECDPSRRAAALIKFRLKRKDRCFQKKVRYHSRKKLAEQRPRVKGQFVKQKNVGSSTATDAEE